MGFLTTILAKTVVRVARPVVEAIAIGWLHKKWEDMRPQEKEEMQRKKVKTSRKKDTVPRPKANREVSR